MQTEAHKTFYSDRFRTSVLAVIAVLATAILLQGGCDEFASWRQLNGQETVSAPGHSSDRIGVTVHTTYWPDGMRAPSIPTGSEIVATPAYCACIDPEAKCARWVAYAIDPIDVLDIHVDRGWRSRWPDITLEESDYTGSGFDRGHCRPLASSGGRLGPYVNDLANVVPQTPDLNRGPWNDFEKYVREVCLRRMSRVYVIVVSLWTDEMQGLPAADESHRVPSHFAKLVTIGDGGEQTAVVMSHNVVRRSTWQQYAVAPNVVKQMLWPETEQ